jgi:hypothetical protein
MAQQSQVGAVRAGRLLATCAAVALAGLAHASTGGSIEKQDGVWVEGPGFDVTYGASYDICARRCLDSQRCVMLEYYRPERKCNLYDRLRPRLSGGASFVGIKR